MALPVKGIGYEVGNMLTAQHVRSSGRRDYCADLELNAAECLEAFGVNKGYDKCVKYMEDLNECKLSSISNARVIIMNLERAKKVATGQIPLKEAFAKPYSYDSYVDGCFLP